MQHTESDYVDIGYRLEKARSEAQSRSLAAQVRRMLESERVEDQPEARRLIESGRQEAR